MRFAFGDLNRSRLLEALQSVDDAITLLEWRYDHEAAPSVERLESLAAEIRVALVLADTHGSPHH